MDTCSPIEAAQLGHLIIRGSFMFESDDLFAGSDSNSYTSL